MKIKEKQKNRTSLNEMFYNKKTQRLEKIDNRLVRKERRLENVNNKTKIQFNDLTQGDDLLVLQEDECKLSMKLLGKKEKEQIKFAARQVKQLQEKKVLYEDVFEDSDVEYEILEDKKIKENIVIKNNNKETYEYQYLLTLENLTLKQEQNTKTLQFVNGKEKALFTIIEPVMFDSNNSSSNDITYEVKQLEDNKYLLTLKADEKWINSKERVLPIYLDPTLQVEAAPFAKWYLINKYESVTDVSTSQMITSNSDDVIQVMEFDDDLMNSRLKDGTITSIKFFLELAQSINGIKIVATSKTLEEIKSNGIPTSTDDIQVITNYTDSGSHDSRYFYSFNITNAYLEGKKRFIITKASNSSSIPIAIYPQHCDYHIDFDYIIDVDKENKNDDLTNISDKLSVSKDLFSNYYRVNILDLQSFNKMTISHLYSTSEFLPQNIKDTLFSQYGENFRLNYSYILYDATYQNVRNSLNETQGCYVLIDPNENITKFLLDDGTYCCETDPKQTLEFRNDDVVVKTALSELVFTKSSLTDFYILKSINDLIYNLSITITYLADKVRINTISDEKGNTLSFEYDSNNMLSSILKSSSPYLDLQYDEGKLILMDFYDYEERRVTFGYGDSLNNICDSYQTNDIDITKTNSSFQIYDNNNFKAIKLIEYAINNINVTNEYGEKQVMVIDDGKVTSSYKLKASSTNSNLALYSNVHYSSYENDTEAQTTRSESGTLNINHNNLTIDSQYECTRYGSDQFNGKYVYYLITSSEESKVVEVTLTNAQFSRLDNNSYYLFGLFLKTTSSSSEEANLTIKLLNGSDVLVEKTLTEIKPIWEFKYVPLKYYETEEKFTSLTIRIEVSGNSNNILFANPILRRDESYSSVETVINSNGTKTTTLIGGGFKTINTYDELNLLENVIVIDLHKNQTLKDENYYYETDTHQLALKNHTYNTFLQQINQIANTYSLGKLTSTTIFSADSSSDVIHKKYEYDTYGNSNPEYDERDKQINSFIINTNGTVSKIVSTGFAQLEYEYTNDKLTNISTPSNSYSVDFEYEDGMLSEVCLNGKTTYTYTNDLDDMSYSIKVNNTLYSYNKIQRDTNSVSFIEKVGSNFERKYVYNLEDKLTSIYENNVLKTTCTNNTYGKLHTFKEIIDDDTSITKQYYYFDSDREKISSIRYSGLYNLVVTDGGYNYTNCNQEVNITIDGTTEDTYKYIYNNNLEKIITKIEYPNTIHEISYNGFGNVSKLTTTNGSLKLINDYTYKTAGLIDGKTRTTGFVESVNLKATYSNVEKENILISHAYNDNGTLSSITLDGNITSYTYDLFGRLKTETNAQNEVKEYSYDNNGNITSIKNINGSVTSITNLEFNNNNELVKITYPDSSFIEFSYDTIGNPILISKNGMCESGTGYETENILLTYEKGNRLSTYGTNISFKYDLSGNRIIKQVNNELHKYYIHGGNIIREEISNATTNAILSTIDFFYDETGLCAFRYNNEMYYYQKDLTGTIIGIYNYLGNIVAKYEYDSWGKHSVLSPSGTENTSTIFIGNINPFRYKSYYYDVETGYFWLSSRYYIPELCRFIQPADVSSLNPHSINGLNLYAYANNNPIGSANVGMLSGFSAITMLPSYRLSITNSNVGSRNYWDPHVKGKWFDTDVPEFFNFTHDKIEFVNWSFSVYKGSLYFDHYEKHSLYIAGGNISTYLGIGSEGVGLDLGANVLEIGYDGRIIDANVEFLTIGLTFMYKDGTFEFGVGAGWFGYSVTIDIDEIIKIIFGG